MRDHYSNDQIKSAEARIEDGMHEVAKRVSDAAVDVTNQAKMHPYATVAIAAGLAFAVGALWKIRARTQQSQLDQLMARLPDMPSASTLRSYWR